MENPAPNPTEPLPRATLRSAQESDRPTRYDPKTYTRYSDPLPEAQKRENFLRLFGGRLYEDGPLLHPAIGWRYRNCTLENFEISCDKQRDAIERLQAFSDDMPAKLSECGGAILYGPPGTGKDHLLAALMRIAIVKHSLGVEWFDGGGLLDAFWLASRDEGDAFKALTAKISRSHIVAISDPQPPRGDLNDSQLRRLRDAIDRRYRDGLTTWITTNIDDRDTSEELLGRPLMQRLREGAGSIHCDWPNHRDGKETW